MQYNHNLLRVIEKYYRIIWSNADINDLSNIFDKNIVMKFNTIDNDEKFCYTGKDVIDKFYLPWSKNTYLSNNFVKTEYEINQKHFNYAKAEYQAYKFVAEEIFHLSEDNDTTIIKSNRLIRIYKEKI